MLKSIESQNVPTFFRHKKKTKLRYKYSICRLLSEMAHLYMEHLSNQAVICNFIRKNKATTI